MDNDDGDDDDVDDEDDNAKRRPDPKMKRSELTMPNDVGLFFVHPHYPC